MDDSRLPRQVISSDCNKADSNDHSFYRIETKDRRNKRFFGEVLF